MNRTQKVDNVKSDVTNGIEVSYHSSGLDSGSVPAIQGNMSTFFIGAIPLCYTVFIK